jgi:hypothetical protein
MSLDLLDFLARHDRSLSGRDAERREYIARRGLDGSDFLGRCARSSGWPVMMR